MLELIDVLDTFERHDGLFVDINLMSDGKTVMSAPYVREAVTDAYFSGYISFKEAAPIADLVAEAEANHPDYISF